MPVPSMLETHGIVSGPCHHVWSSRCHYLIASRASVVLLRSRASHLPDEPISIRMALAPLTAQRIQRPLVIAIIADAAILAAHD